MARKKQMDTHKRISECALELFLKKGVANTAVNDIVAASKISRATFYLYFGGKDAILRECMGLIWEESRLLYKQFAELSDWSEPVIYTWLNDFLNAFQQHEKIVQLVMQGLSSELIVQTAARETRNVATLMGQSIAWNRFTPDEARCRAHLLIYQLQRAMQEFISGRLNIDRRTFLMTLTEVWILTLQKRSSLRHQEYLDLTF